MKKIFMVAAALMLTLTMTVVTSCTNDIQDNPAGGPTHDDSVVGIWYADITGLTYALWNYGTVWNSMYFRADGTVVASTFYTLEGEAVASQSITYNYTVTAEGQLTVYVEDDSFDYTYGSSNGQLTLSNNQDGIVYQKADADMAAKIDEWSQKQLVDVPDPARYTVFVYGNAGGRMDIVIEEGFWKRMKDVLTDSTNVRVVCFYKYGKETSSGLEDDGDIVWFELNSETDLLKLREEGFANYGFAEQAKKMKLCDPASLRVVLELSSLFCPAEKYIFSIWGHGSGFDPRQDVPGKYDQNLPATRGVIGDEWNEREQLDMYELAQAIRESGAVGRMNTIFFHNCLMGNMETLTELRDVTDYICCSSHALNSDGIVLSGFISGLMNQNNTEDAVKQMFEDIRPYWDLQYTNGIDTENGEKLPNGDFKMLRTSKFDGILSATRRLATRIVDLYPTQTEAIGRATTRVYRFYQSDDNPDYSYVYPFFDLADFAHKLAEETADEELAAVSDEMDRAFDEAIVHYADINLNEQHLDHYSLSVCIYGQDHYNYDFVGDGGSYRCNIGEGYEQCSFHQLTGWGNFLSINQQVPHGNPVSEGGDPLIQK